MEGTTRQMPKISVHALFDFEAANQTELSFRKGDVISVTRADVGAGWAEGEKDGAAKASRVVATEGPDKGMEIVFDQPRELTIQRNGLQRKGLQVGRVEVAFPVELKAGASVHLHYTLRALPANH